MSGCALCLRLSLSLLFVQVMASVFFFALTLCRVVAFGADSKFHFELRAENVSSSELFSAPTTEMSMKRSVVDTLATSKLSALCARSSRIYIYTYMRTHTHALPLTLQNTLVFCHTRTKPLSLCLSRSHALSHILTHKKKTHTHTLPLRLVGVCLAASFIGSRYASLSTAHHPPLIVGLPPRQQKCAAECHCHVGSRCGRF